MGHRRSQRHALKTDALLFVESKPTRVGILKNVSRDGATLEYTVLVEGERPFDVGDRLRISIMVPSPVTFMVKHLGCKVEYDIKITYFSVGCVETRRSGLRFESLSDDQVRNLNILLKAFTYHRSCDDYQ